MGRAIRRLVSLYDSLDDLIEAADEHDDVDDDEMELVTSDILDKRQECVDVLYHTIWPPDGYFKDCKSSCCIPNSYTGSAFGRKGNRRS